MEQIKLISFDVGGTILDIKGQGFYSIIRETVNVEDSYLRILYNKYFLTLNIKMELALINFCRETKLTTPDIIIEKYRRIYGSEILCMKSSHISRHYVVLRKRLNV